MQNIEIKRNLNKRSIESLIEESVIDKSFNYEAQQLRQAFNETLANLNQRNAEQQISIEKLKLVIREHQDTKVKLQTKIRKLSQQIQNYKKLNSELNNHYQKTNKKLQHAQYKLQIITQNRNELINQSKQQSEALTKQELQAMRNQICYNFSKVIARKVELFTEELRTISMSTELQNRISSFLQQMILINPHSQSQIIQQAEPIKTTTVYHHSRRIKRYSPTTAVVSQQPQQDEWTKLQKSLQKLKRIAQHSNYSPEKSTEKDKDRSRTPVRRRQRLFAE